MSSRDFPPEPVVEPGPADASAPGCSSTGGGATADVVDAGAGGGAGAAYAPFIRAGDASTASAQTTVIAAAAL
ncbi:hypothetical protein ACFV0Y_36240 [Streptomyces sp. NPDC059569]|uniref:hypothetical protein n=1 Tax=Streptomyces sp. NPDC059569 TaxID=3346869 RepID=UPI0036B2BBA5